MKYHEDEILDLAFNYESKLLASCGKDRKIKLWETSDFADKKEAELLDHKSDVNSVNFDPVKRP